MGSGHKSEDLVNVLVNNLTEVPSSGSTVTRTWCVWEGEPTLQVKSDLNFAGMTYYLVCIDRTCVKPFCTIKVVKQISGPAARGRAHPGCTLGALKGQPVLQGQGSLGWVGGVAPKSGPSTCPRGPNSKKARPRSKYSSLHPKVSPPPPKTRKGR